MNINITHSSLLSLVIQGTLDVEKQVSQQQIMKTLEFCANIFDASWDEEADATVLDKLSKGQNGGMASGAPTLNGHAGNGFVAPLTTDEQAALDHIKIVRSLQCRENTTGMTITSDVLEGRKLRLERGKLGLELVQ